MVQSYNLGAEYEVLGEKFLTNRFSQSLAYKYSMIELKTMTKYAEQKYPVNNVPKRN